MKLFRYMFLAVSALILGSCTNLDENVYDKIVSENYYNTKMDVIRATFRPFEHAFWSIQSRMVLNELTADQLITCTRDGWWEDGAKWRRLHYHEWTSDEGDQNSEWNGNYQGIGQCNKVIEDLEGMSAERFGFSESEYNSLKAQCKVLRCWFYIRLLDAFRNVPLVVSFYDQSKNTVTQVAPKTLFDFIEKELLESLDLLSEKIALGGPDKNQGLWTKAGAAALLVRLYLNAKVYIGEERYDDCATYAENILNGEYGPYEVAEKWDAAFDWNNDKCDEVIFGFPASSGYSYWHYTGDTYNWTVPSQAVGYLADEKSKAGGHNCKYACSPSYDPTGNLYTYALGMPVQKFRAYPNDVRLKLYKNLSDGTREGLFLFGKLAKADGSGFVRDPNNSYDLDIRDAVGQFQGNAGWLTSTASDLSMGDHNSGWHFVKYPLYSDDNEHQMDSDYTEIRLPEIIYALAECKLRGGDANAAGALLNTVRKRNYPAADWDSYSYAPEGTITLTESEMLDEWGREFFAEGRRRIDLVRFGKFNTGTWYDKMADTDDHTSIFCIPRDALNSNGNLNPNPGYGR